MSRGQSHENDSTEIRFPIEARRGEKPAMSEGIILVLLVLVLTTAVIILLALVLKPERLRARISLPWNAGFYIDTSRPGWQRPRPGNARKARASQSQAWLAAKVWGRRDWEYPLDPHKVVCMGQNRDMDIVLRDPVADTRHATVYWKNGRYHINNLSRTKGTKVNGRLITTQRLGDGNKIRMGNTELIFRERRGPA